MSKSNAFETALLQHIFQNAALANVGDATGLPAAATVGSLYVSLHTSDPAEAGVANTNEISYTGYARVGVIRSSSGWAVSAGVASNVAAITFGACTAGSGTATHFGISAASSGAGILLYSGALTGSVAISSGITPEIAAGAATVTED
jgi:hypothetical protein